MDLAWIFPAVVAALALVVAGALARRVTLEADALERDIHGFADQRLAMVEVRDTSREMLEAARALRIPR
jgi:hypothetical protein